MRARIKELSLTLDGGQELTLSLPGDWRQEYMKLKDADVEVEIKKYREKRSLTQNAYAWVLIGKIAESMRPALSKEEVYLMMLKRYGQGGFISVLSDQLELVKRKLDYYEEKGKAVKDKSEFTHLMVWVGSSKYDSHEMNLFISGIVEEAKDLGIETLTSVELAKMEVI